MKRTFFVLPLPKRDPSNLRGGFFNMFSTSNPVGTQVGFLFPHRHAVLTNETLPFFSEYFKHRA